MEEQYEHFQYKLLETVPKEFRELDWTYISLRDKPFSECKEAFDRLRKKLEPAFSGNPFFHLHFLRGIEDRLLGLALEKKQPLSECLKHLRRRLELEYNRVDIPGKATRALLLANYAMECGEMGLVRSLLYQEREQLKETAEVCRANMAAIEQRIGTKKGDRHQIWVK